jgi:hypothetical protein
MQSNKCAGHLKVFVLLRLYVNTSVITEHSGILYELEVSIVQIEANKLMTRVKTCSNHNRCYKRLVTIFSNFYPSYSMEIRHLD